MLQIFYCDLFNSSLLKFFIQATFTHWSLVFMPQGTIRGVHVGERE